MLEKFGGVEELKLRNVADPSPSESEVLVRVEAIGVCYRDTVDREGGYPGMRVPLILGHEMAGTIVEVGSSVEALREGDRVTLASHVPCGSCDLCGIGREQLCRKPLGAFGQSLDGTYAELLVAPERALCRIADGMSPEVAAPLACTVATPLHALKGRARLNQNDVVVITGAGGGLGIHTIKIAKLLGAAVIAVTTSESKSRAIRDAGADQVVYSPDLSFARSVKDLTSGRGASVGVEITGLAVEQMARCLTPGGRMVVLGAVGREPIKVSPGLLILKELEILGSMTCSRRELAEAVQLVASGSLETKYEVFAGLESIPTIHERLALRGVTARAVVVP